MSASDLYQTDIYIIYIYIYIYTPLQQTSACLLKYVWRYIVGVTYAVRLYYVDLPLIIQFIIGNPYLRGTLRVINAGWDDGEKNYLNQLNTSHLFNDFCHITALDRLYDGRREDTFTVFEI